MSEIRRILFIGAAVSAAFFVLLLAPSGTEAKSAEPPQRGPTAHVYLLRGFMNVLSLGLDDLAEKIQRRGIGTSVHAHGEWEGLAAQAAEDYKGGHLRTIIIIGHSLGADAAIRMADRLGQWGVPVRLVVTFDPVSTAAVPANVARLVNFYLPNGIGVAVSRGPGFHGALANIDLEDHPGIGHLSIEKSARLHQQVLGYISGALGSGHRIEGVAASQH